MRASKSLLHKADWLWVLGYPLYQTIGTLRHEASHALVARLEGVSILEFVFWPTWTPTGGVYWGYVRWSGSVSWLATAAPYLCDLLTFGLFFWLCTRVCIPHRGVWMNLAILGLISPLANSGNAYIGSRGGRNDVANLMLRLEPLAVHAYFALTIAVYTVGMRAALKQRAQVTSTGLRF